MIRSIELNHKFISHRPNGKPLYDVDPRRFLPNSSNPQKTKQMPLSSTSQSIQQPQSLLQLAPHQAQTLQETYEKHPELYPAVVQVRSKCCSLVFCWYIILSETNFFFGGAATH